MKPTQGFIQKIFLILAPILSGFLLFFTFPSYDLGWLAWVALVPLFIAISGKGPLSSFFLSYLCGLVFFLGIFSWILQIKGYTYLHHAILDVYLGAYFAIFGLAFAIISKRLGWIPALVTAPFIWVSLEYLRSNASFLALPWGLLAHSQYAYPPNIQIASVTGVYGVSFLIVMVNAALTALIYPLLTRLKFNFLFTIDMPSKRATSVFTFAVAVVLSVSLVYGHVIISNPIVGREIKLSLVQGNIEQAKKWDRKYAGFIMQTYADLTREAAKDHPDLIIWPETATPDAITGNPKLASMVKSIANEAGTYLLLGSAQHRKFEKKVTKKRKYKNSALLIHPEGRIMKQKYDKIRLFPFGEYLPYKKNIPWSLINVPNRGSYIPGKEFTVFQHPGFRFSATICWENMFPDLVRQFVKGGAQLIVNLANEAWFGRTSAPYQFLSMNVFRAVENRVYVIRCANTGISCFIDPYGRVVDTVKDGKGGDIFVRGVLTKNIILLESQTFYTRHGNWLVWVSIICSVGAFLVALFNRGGKSVFDS